MPFIDKTNRQVITMNIIESPKKTQRAVISLTIKTPDKLFNMKQNLNINHIRHSDYKIERNMSHPNGHSIQIKAPLLPPTSSHHPQLARTCSLQPFKGKWSCQDKEIGPQRLGVGTLQRIGWMEQIELLERVRQMWQIVLQLKKSLFFKEEIEQIGNILKSIVLRLAEPKLQILEEGFSGSFKQTSFVRLATKDPSKRSSQKGGERSRDQYHQLSPVPCQKIQSQQLQFKKVNYILEQNPKHSLQPAYSRSYSSLQNPFKQAHPKGQEKTKDPLAFPSIGTMRAPKDNSSELSSFLNSQTERISGKAVFQQQKYEKVFLGSIVKKGRKGEQATINLKAEEGELTSHRSAHWLQFSDSSVHISNSTEQLSFLRYTGGQEPKQSLAPKDDLSISSVDLECGISSVESNSQSKRTTLNTIINMLNRKYHKNIGFNLPAP